MAIKLSTPNGMIILAIPCLPTGRHVTLKTKH